MDMWTIYRWYEPEGWVPVTACSLKELPLVLQYQLNIYKASYPQLDPLPRFKIESKYHTIDFL